MQCLTKMGRRRNSSLTKKSEVHARFTRTLTGWLIRTLVKKQQIQCLPLFTSFIITNVCYRFHLNVESYFEALVVLFDRKMARMFQQKNNQKVVCNLYNWTPILVSNLSILLLPTGSPLMKLWQFWPFQSPPDHTKCYLTAKISTQPIFTC